jgi:hypothetical protein
MKLSDERVQGWLESSGGPECGIHISSKLIEALCREVLAARKMRDALKVPTELLKKYADETPDFSAIIAYDKARGET